MMLLTGFRVGTLVFESRHSRVYRAVRIKDDFPVILKVLRDEPTPVRLARFQQEFSLLHKLKSDAIIRAYSIEANNGMHVMVLEDIGASSLDQLAISGSIPLREWLQLAIRIAAALGQLHSQHIMHKDINPANILWKRETGQVKLIDLGIAAELSREVPEIRNPDRLEGTLAYLSPEQTGRMNRAMDYRTDFYSLGVTFYELLCGMLPFSSGDALEMMHAHIARKPLPVEQVRPDVPAVLGAIISKLMGKTAEERYQTATGLEFDLQTCLQNLDANLHIAAFALGQRDFSGRLHISQKLYGRASQIATLMQAFDRASEGSAELLLVAGYSGVGKSALVREIQKPITRSRGHFIEGKFDQFKRDIPYSSLSQAFRELVREILTSDERVVAGWKDKLLQVLGNNAQVIIDVIPNLELIIGPQPSVPELPAALAQNRFNHEFRNFVGALASPERPLVIFLDDLQWADLPSLQLMSMLLRPPAVPSLLLLGAYRDNEITPAHSLAVTLNEMKKNGVRMQTVMLPPLNLEQVQLILSDTLRADQVQVRELASLCFSKTRGNPFFLNQFLVALVEQNILQPALERGGWRWDIASVRRADITDNIVDLMVAKLHRLPRPTQRVLQGAACLGNVFDLSMLAVVCDMTAAQTAALLWAALQEELVVPLDDHYKYVAQFSDERTIAFVPAYRFLHDRVQQAAYMLSSDAQKAAMHLAIGRLWLKRFSPADQQGMLFDLANHFNLGRSLITDCDERRQLARINLDTARRAKASVAYKPALVYLENALEFVGEPQWTSDYDLVFALYLEAAEAAYLTFDFVRMDQLVATALEHAKDLLDQVKVHEIRIMSFIAQDKYHEVVTTGLFVLRLLGVKFPRRANQAHIILSLVHTKLRLARWSVEDLVALPDVTDPVILAVRKILNRITATAYYALPNYFPLLLLKAIRLTLKYGHAIPGAATDFAAYGMIVGGVLGQIEQSAQYGELALRLQDRPGAAIYKGRTMFVVYATTTPWTKPLGETLTPLAQAYMSAVAVGDLEFAGNAANLYCFYSFYCGKGLMELERETVTYLPVPVLPATANVLKMLRQACLNLMKPSAQMPSLLGVPTDGSRSESSASPSFDESLIAASNSTLFLFLTMKVTFGFLFHDYRGALDSIHRAEKHFMSAVGFFGLAVFQFYAALVRMALAESAMPLERAGMLRKVRSSQKQMKKWAKFAPANFLNKWHLVEAEIARQNRHFGDAGRHYEQAIQLSKEHGFLHEEAMSRELAGRFYLGQAMPSVARVYLAEAQQCYRRWGALSKVKELGDCYPQWLSLQTSTQSAVALHGETLVVTTTSMSGTLDFATVMKASQALSQEIVLERLLKRLMAVAIENAGAQRGVLLLKKGHDWFLEAEKSEIQSEATVLQSIIIDDVQHETSPLPLSLVHYVAHTGESVVIHDALEEKLVADDPYVLKHRPCSLLIVPIRHHGETTGLLYLENNAASGAFTESRVEVLRLLASQAAISIENARLYADMEERVSDRTAELKAMSLRDGLTGVANRRAFDERIKEELARGRRIMRPVCLLLIDIDHFKRVNDDFGHPTGDAFLRLIGATLATECRRASDFVARYGGEEFALVLSDMDLANAMVFAENVRTKVEDLELEIGDTRYRISVSIGVAEARGDGIVDTVGLIAAADRALYEAKGAGRNRVASAG